MNYTDLLAALTVILEDTYISGQHGMDRQRTLYLEQKKLADLFNMYGNFLLDEIRRDVDKYSYGKGIEIESVTDYVAGIIEAIRDKQVTKIK